MYRKRGSSNKGLYPLAGGKGYTARWLERGKLMCQTLRGYTKTDARTFRNGKINDAKAGRAPAIPGRLTFADLVKRVAVDAKAKGNRSSPAPSRALAEHFEYAATVADDGQVVVTRAGRRVADITRDAVRAFEAARLVEGVARSTVNADLRWLRHALNLAHEDGHLASVPKITTPAEKNARTGFFEEAQLAAVVAALPDHFRGVVWFAYYTGWRVRSEVLSLTWAQVDRKAGVVRLEPGTTKNGRGREFPYAKLPPLAQLLDHQLATGEPVSSPYVFHDGGRRLAYKRVRLAFRAACRKAKVPGRLLHDLRRTAARNMLRAGVPQAVAMTYTGHETDSVFRRYAIVDSNVQREGVAKYAAYLAVGSD